MSVIHILDNNLINKIAAGEVVERPASVVKELMENSIDAGATSITVEISGGGIDFIKITDNGKGIPKEQIRTAFLRHATSKISEFEDLEDILTLGFRGEALSSISSVSQVEIITRTAQTDIGTKMELMAGKVISETEIGSNIGTIITMKNLFYNTPARKKFLKKPSTESGYINDVVNRLALGHPEISFKYINNNSVVLHTSGNNDIKTCAFHIYGKEISMKTIEVNEEKNGYTLQGLICMPEISRANRTYENFFINGRYIKSKIVSDAVEDAYRGKLMGGRFPIFILNMTVPSNTVDVNVHPTKLEARFSDENFIYEFVYDSVYLALKNKVLIPDVKIKEKSNNFVEETKVDFSKIKDEEFFKQADKVLESDTKKITDTNNLQEKKAIPKNRAELADLIKSELLVVEDVTSDKNKKMDFNEFIDDTPINTAGVVNVCENNIKEEINTPLIIEEEVKNNTPLIVEENENLTLENVFEKELQENKKPFFNNYKIVGQIFKTYWLIEQDEILYMIDQHAAHERALYEEFMEKFKKQATLSQRLLQPIAVDLSEREKEVLKENFKLIEDFGFEIEEFGRNTYAIRSVPYIFKNPENVTFFKDIIDILGDKNFENIYDMKIDSVATMACKAAVKGNDKLDYIEAKALIEKIISLENPFNCPHGRPTIVKLTKYDIEKFFKRVL